MSAPRAHVIGAGLAGLGAAVGLAQAGLRVELSDQAAQAGGRCRSYFDRELGLTIDNGNHLVLSGNGAVRDYLAATNAADRLAGPEVAAFPYVDLRDGARWTLRPNEGPLGWWVLSPARRIPGTRAADYLPLMGLVAPPRDATVGDVVPTHGPVWERMLENFLVAVLNTPAAEGSARLASAVVRETLLKGGAHYRPRVAEPTLAAAFVDPALAWLGAMGARCAPGPPPARAGVRGRPRRALALRRRRGGGRARRAGGAGDAALGSRASSCRGWSSPTASPPSSTPTSAWPRRPAPRRSWA